MTDAPMLKAKVATAFEKIGRANGTAPETSQDPVDPLAHEYNVASTLFSIAEKRKDNAKIALLAGIGENASNRLLDTKASVKKNQITENITLITAANHTVNAKVTIGATFLDVDGLKVALLKTMDTEAVNKLFEKHTKRRDPSVTLVVSEADG